MVKNLTQLHIVWIYNSNLNIIKIYKLSAYSNIRGDYICNNNNDSRAK